MSEGDWKTIEDALDMWAATQVAIRGHVNTVREAVARLHKERMQDAEMILRFAEERNAARDRVKELEEVLRHIRPHLPMGGWLQQRVDSSLGT